MSIDRATVDERLAETLRALHVSAHAMTLLTRAMRDQRRGTRRKP
jgi:hypothetical protein